MTTSLRFASGIALLLLVSSGLFAQTLSAPATAQAGSSININIQGSFDSRDFITIVAPDKPEGGYDHYVYARSASVEIRVPETAGSYQIRLLDDAAPYPTLHQLELTIEATSASLQAPDSVTIGSAFKVQWQGPDNHQDFITIVPGDAAERQYGAYKYTRNGSPLELRAPAEPGDYAIRYLTGVNYFTLASIPIKVVDTSATLDFQPSVSIGGDISVSWTGPDNQQDFITIVPAGSEQNAYNNYTYTRHGSPLNIKLPESPGEYEVRYLTSAKQGYRVLGSAPLQVGDSSVNIQAPEEAVAGSRIGLEWQGPDNQLDFITVVPAGSEDSHYANYVYTHNGSPGELLMPEQPGEYELKYLTAQERRVLARVPITLLPPSAALTAPNSAEAGQPFGVSWEGPNNPSDYIAVTDAGSPADYHAYSYTRRGNPVSIRAPYETGDYELHYLTGQDDISLASLPFTVTPSSVPGTLRVMSASDSTETQINTFGAVELILDASGSMLQQLDGQRRIAIAKQTLLQLVNNLLPDNSQYALRVFGHRQPDACDTELLQPMGPLNRSAASAVINSIEAKNLARTPIADSLAQVANDLAGVEGEALVILVTDGEETCEGNPAEALEALRASGFDVRVNIIGFAIDEYALKQEFTRWAEIGGGAYFDANNADALTDAMQQSLEVTFNVYDERENIVAGGSVNGPDISLPAGDYQVRIGQQSYSVTIESGEENIVSL